jgi:glycerol-3-phosphate cytidylyltransferase
MEKYKVGFTAGVFDMFHIGHLNLLRKAKDRCDYLIVGVNSNSLVASYKGKETVIDEEQRREIVSAIKYVDRTEIMDSLDKVDAWQRLHFDVVFIGDDWKGSERWNQTERDLAQVGVKVVYIPYTKHVTSTALRGDYPQRVKE